MKYILYNNNNNNVIYYINMIFLIHFRDTMKTKELKERRIEKVFRNVPLKLKVTLIKKRSCPYQIEETLQIPVWKIFNDKKIDSFIRNYTN